MDDKSHKLATKAVHSGEPKKAPFQPVIEPVYMSSTYVVDEKGGYNDAIYMRMSNTPNHLNLHKKLASLEGTDSALVTSSGMAAVTTVVLTFLKSGDHMLSQHDLYGGTYGFFTHDLAKYGIEYDFFDPTDIESLKSKIKPNTKLVYTESLSNPLLGAFDYTALTNVAKEHNLVSVIDNTIPTPSSFRPVKFGFDISLHSATKYLNGHSDIMAGVVAGSSDLIREVKLTLDHFGGTLGAHACFLLNRGLKTFPLRMQKHGQNALKIANFLDQHPKVKKVNYPSLKSHSSNACSEKYFDYDIGILSCVIDADGQKTANFVKNLELFYEAPSFGGVESLVCRPINTSHANFSEEELKKAQITPNLVRISPGVEAAEDLIADISQALDTV